MAEILSPVRHVRISRRDYWIKQNISWELKAKAKVFHSRIVEENRFGGMLRRESVPSILERLEISFSSLERLDAELLDSKISLYKRYPDEFAQKPIRDEIKFLRREIAHLHHQYNLIDGCTLESYADKKATLFLLQKLGNLPRSFNFLEKFYMKMLENSCTLSQIRSLARDDYWRSQWMVKKAGIFKYDPLTDEQLSLATFSRMYENISKHPEPPPNGVINDDDMLDGWLALQNQERKPKKNFGSKIENSKEIFIMAKNQEEADKIYGANSMEARSIQNIRTRQLQKQGTVEYGRFADVQRERVMEANAR